MSAIRFGGEIVKTLAAPAAIAATQTVTAAGLVALAPWLAGAAAVAGLVYLVNKDK
jgi:hypothetical protein